MSLKQELETIQAATDQLLCDCNAVIGAYLNPAEVLAELPSRIEDVHGVGYTAGNDDGFATGQQIGHDSGVEVGKRQAYDAFWDAYQQNGNRTSYDYAFYGRYWTDDIFDPKYKMIPTNMSQCFYGANNVTRDLTADMIDTSRCTNMYFAFSGLSCTALPVVDMRAVTAYSNARYPFYNCTRLQTIEGLYLPQVGVEKPFHNCESLREVRLLGDGKFLVDVDMGVCPLSKASIESVMAALSDTVTGQTATFNKTAVDAAFTAEEWAALVASKPNWTVTLA